MRITLSILFTFTCFHFNLTAQINEHFSTADGLPSNEAYYILQDSIGNMWFATDHGICKYDGYHFEKYDISDGLEDNTVFTMQELDKGRIMLLTLSGLMFFYEPENDRITPYKYNEIIQKYFEGINSNFHYDHKIKTLYISIKTKGVLVIDSLGNDKLLGKSLKTTAGYFEVDKALVPYITNMTYNAPSRLEELNVFSAETNEICSLDNAIYTGQSQVMKSIFIGQDEYLLLLLGNIIHIKNNKAQFLTQLESAVSINLIDDKIIIVNGTEKGIYIYQSINDIKIGKYRHIMDGTSVSNLYFDRSQGIWVSTLENGIYYFKQKEAFLTTSQYDVFGRNIHSLSTTNNNKLVLSIDNIGIFEYNTIKDSLKHHYKTNKVIYQIEKWNDNTFFFITIENIKRYHYLQNKLENLWMNEERIGVLGKNVNISPFDSTLCISISNGFGLYNERLKYFEMEAWNKIDLDEKAFRTFSCFKDNQGQIWVGKGDGLFYVENKHLRPLNEKSKIKARVESIVQFHDKLIVGTKGKGVFMLKDHQLIPISNDDEMKTLMVSKMKVLDDKIAIATNTGLYMLTFDSNDLFTYKKFNTSFGLPSNDVNDIEWIDGKVYVATTAGLGIISQLDYKVKNIAPTITSVANLRNGKVSSYFKSTENDVAISFKTINYRLGGKILYRYRLNEKSLWTSTYETKANFLNLSSATYLFEVQSRDEDGNFSKSSLCQFTIAKPFYLTSWFIGSALSIFLGATYLFYKKRLAKLKNAHQLERQLKDLELSALQSQMNPHFIFNCLNSIQNYIIGNEKDKAASYLAKFSRLIRKVLDASVHKEISLDKEIELLTNYIELEQMRFKNRFNYSIDVDANMALNEMKIQPLLIQPIVENAIVHAMHDNGMGMISIGITTIENRIKFTITDNGPGIQVKQNQDHQSVGLSNTKQRILLNSHTNPSSKIVIENILVDNIIKGTRVSIVI